MKNGTAVAAFEKAFASYVGAKYAIALTNGTSTLHTALVALGVKPGDRVAVPPLTMSATTIAVLQAGAVPVFVDVDPRTWIEKGQVRASYAIPVSLYGLHYPEYSSDLTRTIDDAAQTLRPRGGTAFTSYSFQASKILALGEGGMLVTDDEELATKAREFSSLGYRMKADQPRIDPAILKSPDYERHHSFGYNYRMNDVTAEFGLAMLDPEITGGLLLDRQSCASLYREAIQDCEWITPQYVPEGWTHDYWSFAIALRDKSLWKPFTDAIVRNGGEMPYGAWRLTYDEPAFRYLRCCDACRDCGEWARPGCTSCRGDHESICPVAEDLQPRLVQFQTNDLASAERNAKAVKKAIEEIDAHAQRLDRVFA